jgi:hypothetical protein
MTLPRLVFGAARLVVLEWKSRTQNGRRVSMGFYDFGDIPGLDLSQLIEG